MKLTLIRHGDPNYRLDALTERGKAEVKALAEYLSGKPEADAYYTSPLGRARLTAQPVLDAFSAEAEILPWLKEFEGRMNVNGKSELSWDMLPRVWTSEGAFYDVRSFLSADLYRDSNVAECYKTVTDGLDELLARYGYIRSGAVYFAEKGSEKSITLFCHLGVMFVILSHLLNISPVLLWQGFHVAPTSITSVVTEEREEGIAGWRVTSLGACPHLERAGLEPSDAGLFRETYGGSDGIR
jgi:broad specificity phosphatase PhoE